VLMTHLLALRSKIRPVTQFKSTSSGRSSGKQLTVPACVIGCVPVTHFPSGSGRKSLTQLPEASACLSFSHVTGVVVGDASDAVVHDGSVGFAVQSTGAVVLVVHEGSVGFAVQSTGAGVLVVESADAEQLLLSSGAEPPGHGVCCWFSAAGDVLVVAPPPPLLSCGAGQLSILSAVEPSGHVTVCF